MPRLAGALGQAARSALQIDRSKIAVDVGLRAAVGVGLTLVVGRATGHTVAGVTATIGALSAGMASHQGTYRSRAAVVLAAAAAMGFCAFVGGTIGHLLGPDIAVTALIGFLGALMVCLGPSGTVVGIQAVVGLVVFSQFAFPVPVAARDGGLVLLGGAVQALLIVAVWPLRRFPAERRAIGDAYGRLADFCRAATSGGVPLLDAGALEPLGPVTRDAQPFGGDEAAAHRVLADQADRIRLELVALARAGARTAELGGSAEAAAVDRVLGAAAHVLDGISHAVRSGTGTAAAGEGPGRVEEAVEAMRSGAGRTGGVRVVALAAADPVRRSEALAGQLRTAARAAAVAAGAERPPSWPGVSARRAGRRHGSEWLRERAATIRSNLTMSSQAFRHALRMAVTLAVAVAVSHAFGFAHRYWLPMTAMLILRPDFGSTVTRGLARVLGTLVGAGVVTVILAEARPGPDWLIALVVLLCFPATALVLANYAVFSVCIASLVVTLLAFTGNPELTTARDRSIYTALGALMALGAYALWPTWEATSLPDTLSELARTEARYGSAVLGAWADPPSADRAALQRTRLDARLARSNAEASVTRWMSEPQPTDPGRPPLGRDTVLGYTAAVRAYVAAVLTLHAELPADGPARPGVARLAGDVEEALLAVADTVKGSPPVAAPPPLRSEQLALAAAMGVGAGRPSTGTGSEASPAGDPDPAALVLAGETDLMVNSINTLCHLVGLQPG